MDKPSIWLENLFFPHQVVRANNGHQAQGSRDGSQVVFEHGMEKIAGRENAFGLQLAVRLDEEKSVNAPYVFTVVAYGVFAVDPENALSEDKIQEMLMSTGMPVLVGAVRERLADLTARAPWGIFNLNIVSVE